MKSNLKYSLLLVVMLIFSSIVYAGEKEEVTMPEGGSYYKYSNYLPEGLDLETSYFYGKVNYALRGHYKVRTVNDFSVRELDFFDENEIYRLGDLIRFKVSDKGKVEHIKLLYSPQDSIDVVRFVKKMNIKKKPTSDLDLYPKHGIAYIIENNGGRYIARDKETSGRITFYAPNSGYTMNTIIGYYFDSYGKVVIS